jgi:EAL domain-containing protein (putative c-di-GMP-specific phosphodiesterase class I)
VRIREIISGQRLLTAFQPIHDLAAGRVIGVEALSRFVSDDGAGADYWFGEASAVGLGTELEFAAFGTALTAAEELPPCLYVALNISPDQLLWLLSLTLSCPFHGCLLEPRAKAASYSSDWERKPPTPGLPPPESGFA